MTDLSAQKSSAATSTGGFRLGDLLLKRSLITPDQLAAADREQRRNGGQFAPALVRLGIIDDDELTNCLLRE